MKLLPSVFGTIIIFLALSLLLPGLQANDVWSQQIPFATWLEGLKAEAEQGGISGATLDKAFANLTPLQKILDSDRNQPEFKRNLDQYLATTINRVRIDKGRRLLREHWKLFAKISSDYAVQPRFLVALWGIETDFGRRQGKVPVIQALATLAYDPRRSSYFKQELFNALIMLDRNQVSLRKLKGSWAGAMGQMQFMPSTFLQYAVDYDQDGKIDIWTSRTDALASAANYLQQLGWKNGWTWGREVRLPADFDKKMVGLDIQLGLSEWQRRGIRNVDGGLLPKVDVAASLIQPDGRNGRAFLIYDNYRKLLSWNRSHNFAIAVGMLADQIGE